MAAKLGIQASQPPRRALFVAAAGVAIVILLALAAGNQARAASLLESLTPNIWQSGNLQRSYSDPNLSNRTFTFRRTFRPPQRQASLDGGARRRPSHDGHCSTNYGFDYVQLTLQWAPGACSTSPHQCKRIQDKHFTVHGMWPTKRGTREPANCCFDNTFDFDALKPLLPDLDEYWYSYFDRNSMSFWSHEWLKHGTCSRNVPQLVGEVRYFGTTVKMAKSMPILEVLAKVNVVPNKDNKPYQSQLILKALQDSISNGKQVSIDCDYEHTQPIPVLTGLNFCFNSDLQPADCPETKNKCKRQLLFRA